MLEARIVVSISEKLLYRTIGTSGVLGKAYILAVGRAISGRHSRAVVEVNVCPIPTSRVKTTGYEYRNLIANQFGMFDKAATEEASLKGFYLAALCSLAYAEGELIADTSWYPLSQLRPATPNILVTENRESIFGHTYELRPVFWNGCEYVAGMNYNGSYKLSLVGTDRIVRAGDIASLGVVTDKSGRLDLWEKKSLELAYRLIGEENK